MLFRDRIGFAHFISSLLTMPHPARLPIYAEPQTFLVLLSTRTFSFCKNCFCASSSPEPVLPDSIFSNQKSQFGQILKGLAMEDVGIL
jgi:hypothetical protein